MAAAQNPAELVGLVQGPVQPVAVDVSHVVVVVLRVVGVVVLKAPIGDEVVGNLDRGLVGEVPIGARHGVAVQIPPTRLAPCDELDLVPEGQFFCKELCVLDDPFGPEVFVHEVYREL